MKALFQGSFDPFTAGHENIVRRALTVCDHVVVAVVVNVGKHGMLTSAQRKRLIERVFAGEPRVSVVASDALTVDVARHVGATCLLRGVRSSADVDYELAMAQTNRELGGIETLLLPAEPRLAHVSSSLVRELLRFGVNVTPYLPAGVTAADLEDPNAPN